MSRIINIQGTNGSGKSTIARSYIEHYGLKEQEINIKTAGSVIVQTNDEKSIFVIGKYSGGQCGGCDTIKSTGVVLETLLTLLNAYKPQEILFEGILIAGNQTFAQRGLRVAQSVGYDFEIIFLDRGADACINAVAKRNGGKPFNVRQVVDKYRSCEKVYEKARGLGIRAKKINPDDYKKEKLWEGLYE